MPDLVRAKHGQPSLFTVLGASASKMQKIHDLEHNKEVLDREVQEGHASR
jgi:hypothetical protein